MASQIFIENI